VAEELIFRQVPQLVLHSPPGGMLFPSVRSSRELVDFLQLHNCIDCTDAASEQVDLTRLAPNIINNFLSSESLLDKVIVEVHSFL